MTHLTETKHPAKYSAPVLEALDHALFIQWASHPATPAEFGETRPLLEVLDPFAGVGTIHQLDTWARTWGVELEPEWADQHERTICGDSSSMPFFGDGMFDTIATSPAYGNRMADQYLPPESDKSARYTYAISLGRECSEGSGAAVGWSVAYERLHGAVWAECDRVLAPGGRVLLNCKNHFRKGVEQPVTEWHIGWFTDRGYSVLSDAELGTDGIKNSPHQKRCAERLIVLKKAVAS